MGKNTLISYAQRIEWWIVLFFVVRCIGICNAPLEAGHSWRQCTGLMVARNFYEVDASIFYPRIDVTNGKEGIVAMEFPTLYYLVYLVSEVVGYDHWYGRLINLLVSSLGIWFFYRLLSNYFSQPIAYWSSLLLLVSLWFSFSRKTMADTFCVSVFFIALYYGFLYIKEGGAKNALLYFLFAAVGVLSKIPAGIYAVLFVFPLFSGRWCTARKGVFIFLSLGWLCMVYAWYFVWNVHLSALEGSWYNAGMSFGQGLNELVTHPEQTLSKFYFSAFSSYVLFGLFVAGVFFLIKNREKRALGVAALISAIFLIYMLKSGYYFHHHNYYILPFVPVMAFVAAHALVAIRNKRWVLSLFIVGATEALLNQQHDFFIHDDQKYKLKLEAVMNTVSQGSDLIAINGGGDPQLMYFSHRKGWSFDAAFADDTKRIEQLGKEGAKWLVIDRKTEQRSFPFLKIYTDEWFDVYQLVP